MGRTVKADAGPITIPHPPAQLTLEQAFGIQHAHRKLGLWLQPGVPGGEVLALSGDPEALVASLVRLSIEALLIHQLAEQEPHRPVAELLSQVVNQLKGS